MPTLSSSNKAQKQPLDPYLLQASWMLIYELQYGPEILLQDLLQNL